jgi:hypothetical protein
MNSKSFETHPAAYKFSSVEHQQHHTPIQKETVGLAEHVKSSTVVAAVDAVAAAAEALSQISSDSDSDSDSSSTLDIPIISDMSEVQDVPSCTQPETCSATEEVCKPAPVKYKRTCMNTHASTRASAPAGIISGTKYRRVRPEHKYMAHFRCNKSRDRAIGPQQGESKVTQFRWRSNARRGRGQQSLTITSKVKVYDHTGN